MIVAVTVLRPATKFLAPVTSTVAFESLGVALTVTAVVKGATSKILPGAITVPLTFSSRRLASFENAGF